MFSLFKSKPKMTVALKAPESFEANSLSLAVQLTLASPTQASIEKLSVKLRADPIKKSSGSSFHYIGESVITEPLVLAPAKPEQLSFTLQLDFSPIDSFDIPPENLAVASKEMKAAAAANRTSNYKYFVEVSYKTADGQEQATAQPIRLVQENEIRTG